MQRYLSEEISRTLKEIFKLETSSRGPDLNRLKKELEYDDLDKLIKLLRALESFGFVRINPRNEVKLTKKGRRLTLEIIRNQELPETIISKFIGVPIGISNLVETEGKDAEKDRCDREEIRRLISIEPPQLVEIVRIIGHNPRIEKQLLSIGIIPGVKAYVKTRATLGGTLILKIRGFEVALSSNVAHKILVKPIKM
ncbi:MAG: FeoA domain-containing protein [Candidatus Odinarchaeia archaeon]